MPHPVILAALLAQVSPTGAPSTLPSGYASSSPTPAPQAAPPVFSDTFPGGNPLADYRPIPCATLIARAHLAGKTIDAANLGVLFGVALEQHGVRPRGKIEVAAIVRAEADFNACFGGRKA